MATGARHNKTTKQLILLAIGVMLMCGTTACNQEPYAIRLVTEYKGETVDLCNSVVREYLEAEAEEEQAEILEQNSGINLAFQNMDFQWEGDGSSQYTVHFSESEDFKNSYVYETTLERLDSFGHFVPGKRYYWKVEGDTENSVSKVDSFVTLDATVRFITTNTIINVRDLGGWKTEEGKQVNYSQIYRGGRTNSSGDNVLDDADKKLFAETLGIKTEIDLRTPGVDDLGQTASVFGEHVKYVKAPMQGYSYNIPGFSQTEPFARSYSQTYTESIRQIFEVLGDEDNYPVYFHCNAGADRTGTLAYLINGLLGVSYEDLTRDFELTSFSLGGKRWRSEIVDGTFSSKGVMQDNYDNYVAWDRMYQIMRRRYATEEGTLASMIENYLIKACQVEEKDIETLRNMMLK